MIYAWNAGTQGATSPRPSSTTRQVQGQPDLIRPCLVTREIKKQANTFELFNHVPMVLNGFLQDQFWLVHLPPPLCAHRIRMVPVNTVQSAKAFRYDIPASTVTGLSNKHKVRVAVRTTLPCSEDSPCGSHGTQQRWAERSVSSLLGSWLRVNSRYWLTKQMNPIKKKKKPYYLSVGMCAPMFRYSRSPEEALASLDL